MSSSLYTPLLAIGLVYAGLSIYAGIASRRGDSERGERMLDIGFAVALMGAAYTLILLILAAIDTPGRFTDAVTIMAVVIAFFILLVFALFAVSQVYSRLRGRTGS